MTAFPSFIGPSYESPSYLADAEQTINLYTQTVESGGRTTSRILCPMPGFQTFATFTEAPIRASFSQDGRNFHVGGFSLMEVFGDGTSIDRGLVANDTLPACISSSGDAGRQLFIVSGGSGYVYSLATNVLAAVPSAGTGLVQGGYLDGYFWALDNTSTFRISNLLDGATWDPLQVAQRNDAPDRWLAGMTIGKYIWLWGSETTSVLYDSGAFPFPFSLVPGVLIPRGIGAPFSVADVNGSPIWLEQNRSGARMIVRADGFGAPVRISNHAVEYALSKYTTLSDAEAFPYEWEGHTFYQIAFPTQDDAWAVDALTGDWAKPLLWDTTLAVWHASRARTHCVAFGKHLVGDRSAGKLYALSGSVYTDADGAYMRRVRRCPLPRLLDTSEWIRLRQFQVLMDVGIGLASGTAGVDPQVMFRISRDGGKTWGPEHWTSAGKIGEYLTRVIWQRLGRYRDGLGVVEIVVSEPVPYRFIGAEFEVA